MLTPLKLADLVRKDNYWQWYESKGWCDVSGLASFSNSRVKPRKATESANTKQITIATSETVVSLENQNRTYLSLRNLDMANVIFYGYPLQFGDLIAKGFQLKAGDAIDMESTQEIRAIAVGASVNVCIDEGQG